MEEYKTAIIYAGKGSLLPVVFAEIKGEKIPFVIDSGACYSILCLKHVTELGFAKEDLKLAESDDASYRVGYLLLPL